MSFQKTALPHKSGGFATLTDALDYAASGEDGVFFYNNQGGLVTELSYAQLRTQALKTAGYLQLLELPRKSPVAIIAETRSEFLTVFFACQYLGLIPCPMPFTLFLGGQEAYSDKLKQMVTAAKARFIIAPDSIAQCLEPLARSLAIKLCFFEQINEAIQQTPLPSLSKLTPFSAEETAYIQFSSGSTANPKGIVVTQAAVSANIRAILHDGMKLTSVDRACSWLPFYHDMGLVGFILAPISGQCSVDYLSPTNFARYPTLWLKLISQNRCTITYAPGFGYKLAIQRLKTDTSLDLSCLRIAGIGGDMIQAEILESFGKVMAAYGFRFDAFMPSYGMAEATLAVTMKPVRQAPVIDQREKNGRLFPVVGCGLPLPGYAIKIIDPQTHNPQEGVIGQIWIKGPSIIACYLDKTQNSQTDKDGFMYTGDLGYIKNQQLFVTGREKDLLIVNGRNIWAQDIEWVVCQCDSSLRQNDVAVISVERKNTEQLTILIHCYQQEAGERLALVQRIQTSVNQYFGVAVHVVFIAPRSLTLTSSGKLARAVIKAHFIQHKLTIAE